MTLAFNNDELPLKELKKLGLYQDGKLLLEEADLHGLLAGRRTDFVRLNNLRNQGVHIPEIDTKLSLHRDEKGKVSLLMHPINNHAAKHPLLTDQEMQQLQEGKLSNIRKTYAEPEGQEKTWVIEYDRETREYISYDPGIVQAPDRIGQYQLNDEEKKKFRNGDVLEIEGDKVQHRASDPRGVWSDRNALVLSILLDGGISYLLLRGMRSLAGRFESGGSEVKTAYVPMLSVKEHAQNTRTPVEIEALQRDVPQVGEYLGQQEKRGQGR